MSMKLVILGALIEGEKHPYDIQQLIKQREMDRYIKFQKGSLYYSIEQLEKNGFIEVSKVIRDTSRPDKTIYRITDKGRLEFEKLALEQLASTEYFYNPINSAIAFSDHIDGEKLCNALKQRIHDLELNIRIVGLMYDNYLPSIPKYGLYMMAASIEHMKTEIKWLSAFLRDAFEGRLMDKGTPIDLDKQLE